MSESDAFVTVHERVRHIANNGELFLVEGLHLPLHFVIGPNVTLNVQIVQGLALRVEIDVGRGIQSVVLNGDGGEKQSVDNVSMGNNRALTSKSRGGSISNLIFVVFSTAMLSSLTKKLLVKLQK